MSERKYFRVHPSDSQVQDFQQEEQISWMARRSNNEKEVYERALQSSLLPINDQRSAQAELRRLHDLSDRLPGLIASSADRIHCAIDDGILPITYDRVESRLEEMTMIVDTSTVDDDLKDSAGIYYPDSGLTRLLTGIQEGEEEEVVVHEMIHVLSGREIIGYRGQDGQNGFLARRSGLLLHNVKVTYPTSYHELPQQGDFMWLNEAITEELTLRVLQQSYGTYIEERELFNLLRKRGKHFIPMRSFLDAYFEDYDPNVPEAERTPHIQALMKEIEDTYWPDFLKSLDDIATMMGVEAAISIMKAGYQ